MTVASSQVFDEDLRGDDIDHEVFEDSDSEQSEDDSTVPCPHAQDCNCSKTFKIKRTAIRHSKTHLYDRPCYLCDNFYTRADRLMKHFDATHPECEKWKLTCRYQPHRHAEPAPVKIRATEYPCPHGKRFHCTKVFQHRHTADRHGKLHLEEWPCSLCRKVCARKDSLESHLRTVHPGNQVENLQPRIKNDEGIDAELDVYEPASSMTLNEGEALETVASAGQSQEPDADERSSQRRRAGSCTVRKHQQPTVEGIVGDDDPAIFNNNDAQFPVPESIPPNAVLPKPFLKPALKRTFPSTSTLIPSDSNTASENRSKKRVRFSSPIDEQFEIPPSSTPSPTSARTIKFSPASRRPRKQSSRKPRPRKVSPPLPTFKDITFYSSPTYGFCALLRRNNIQYALSENREFLINGYKKLNTSRIRDSLIRASRWAEGDRDICFYYAQLIHRGLPTTRDREVAKWRLYEEANAEGENKEQNRRLKQLKSVLLELQTALRGGVPSLKSGERKVDHGELDWSEGCGGEVKDWMTEEPSRDIKAGKGCNEVMRYWTNLRSPLPRPEGYQHPTATSESSSEDSDQMPVADEHSDDDGDDSECYFIGRHEVVKATKNSLQSVCSTCFEFPCACTMCQRCWQPCYRKYRMTCDCYCKDCQRPMAKVFGVVQESAPPGYYCRCKTDPYVKKYYDEVCGRQEVFTASTSYYDLFNDFHSGAEGAEEGGGKAPTKSELTTKMNPATDH